MDAALVFQMDKPVHNRGFTMIEMLITLVAISILYLLIPKLPNLSVESHLFVFDYYVAQSKAIVTSTNQQLNIKNEVVYFNEKGNVRQAQTLVIGNDEFVSNLGLGRLAKK